jgi:hypothetical protein
MDTDNFYVKLFFYIILSFIIIYLIYLIFFSKLENYIAFPQLNPNKKIGIGTTVKNPHQLNDWIKYHLSINFDKLYIVFDDETENYNFNPEYINNNKVKIFKNNDNWKNELVLLPDMAQFIEDKKEVMSRQIANFTNVRNYAKKDGIDWLLHIDADELFYPEDKNLVDIFDNLYDTIHFKNYEMIPIRDDYKNCFRDGINFKINSTIYNAYANGKSSVKVCSNAKIAGVHNFAGSLKLTSNVGKILHYPSCNFNEYINKYKILGKFGDKWWDAVPIPFKFHTQSRDIITSCNNNEDNCISKVREYYNKSNVLNNTYNKEDIDVINFVRNQLI